MSDQVVFEVCAEGLDACLAARDGGAHRIELCSALTEGGLTPSHAVIRAAVLESGLPVYAMLRPRGGDFVYSEVEFALMQEDLAHARDLGVSGFVAGMLMADGSVDRVRMERLVERAGSLEVTFHRAIDDAADLERSLEDVIEIGCRRVLTSGGAVDVLTGALRLRSLVEQAAGRIAIAVGGGLRLETAAEVARVTRAPQFHGTVRRRESDGRLATHAADVRTMIAALEAGLSS